MIRSSPPPPVIVSLPSPPISTSSLAPPSIASLPSLPTTMSSPCAGEDLQGDLAGLEAAGLDDVVAGEAVDDQLVAGLGVIDGHLRREAEDRDLAAVRGDDGDVVAVGGIDGHRVDLAVTGRAADRGGQVDVDQLDVGAREIADVDVVGPAEGVELDGLDIVQVHDDVGDVAGEEHAPAVGEDVDVLGDVGAVEEQGVDAVLALDGVVVVAGVPDEQVVAGAEECDVVAVAAVDRVVALAADHDVVAEAAVHLQRRSCRPRGRWR